MTAKNAKTENAFIINKDNWHEQINILKRAFPNVGNPEWMGREIAAGRLNEHKVRDWKENNTTHNPNL